MLEKLSEEEILLIVTKYGEDLINLASEKLSKEQINKFYRSLVFKMKNFYLS